MKKLNTKEIRSIVSLKELGYSERQIVAMVNVGKGSVGRIWNTARENGLTSQLLATCTSEEVNELFYPKAGKREPSKRMPDFQKIHSNISRYKDRSLFHEWFRYRKEDPDDSYSYGWTTVLYRRWCKVHNLKPVLLMNEPFGLCMYIDWAGRRMKFDFPGSNKQTEVHFFVATLGASQMPYVEATLDEKTEAFIRCNVNALKYYGGVPKYVIPDNLRTAIKSHKDREFELQSAFEDLQEHYGFVTLPAHKVSPTEKNDVENEVGISYDWILSELDEHSEEYHSLEDVNHAIRIFLSQMADLEFRKTGLNRREWFISVDYPELSPLPKKDFSIYSYEFTEVPHNYHVNLRGDNHKYSVPYQYIGKEVMMKYSFTQLRVFDMERELIAEWQRSYGNVLNNVHTDDRHRPPAHQVAAAMKLKSPDWLLAKAREVGMYTEQYIKAYLNSKKHYEDAYDGCMGIITMTWKNHGDKQLSRQEMEQICREGLELHVYNYGFVKNRAAEVRKTRAGGEERIEKNKPTANLRGKDKYKL